MLVNYYYCLGWNFPCLWVVERFDISQFWKLLYGGRSKIMTILLYHYHYQYYYHVPSTVLSIVHRVFFFQLKIHKPHRRGTAIILILPIKKLSPQKVNSLTWVVQLITARAETSESAFKATALSHIHWPASLSICWSFLFDSLSFSLFFRVDKVVVILAC